MYRHADYCWDLAGGSAVYILQGASETTTKIMLLRKGTIYHNYLIRQLLFMDLNPLENIKHAAYIGTGMVKQQADGNFLEAGHDTDYSRNIK